MEKIFYVITVGSYSDYSVIGVTDDKTKADNYCKLFPRCKIEEHKEIHNTTPYVGMSLYQVEEYITDRICEKGTVKAYKEESGYNEENAIKLANEKTVIVHRDNYLTYVFAVDEEHAKKIALDRFAVKKAEEANIV